MPKGDERICPGCGELHASSLIPAAELAVYVEDPEELDALIELGAGTYRVFTHVDDADEATRYVVAHKEG